MRALDARQAYGIPRSPSLLLYEHDRATSMQDRTDHSIKQTFSFTVTFKFAKLAPAEKTLEAPAPSQHLSKQVI